LKTFIFGIRKTPKGAVAWMQAPSGRVTKKRFRNGYVMAETSAQGQIDEWANCLREMVEINGVQNCEIVQNQTT